MILQEFHEFSRISKLEILLARNKLKCKNSCKKIKRSFKIREILSQIQFVQICVIRVKNKIKFEKNNK